ncbi:hypothetical protein L208DRAFT_943495 [Tricholoma matsutake]|nr:hypothetical protein L208DRAFT_943495 [Tricholoma matsutake 945]
MTTINSEAPGKLCRLHCCLEYWYHTHIVYALLQINVSTKDFVEEHATSGNRANVATALYPILRAVFFSSSSLPRFGGGLSYTLYQLLSETVTAQPVNQRKLRSPEFLGGKQIGMILSHSKDFLAIEALLELFAKLLPSTKSKGGLEKRSAFIHEVFDPATIAGSEQVVHVLKTISVTDWETTFLKILDILAGADVSYPQPFETSKFRTHGLPTCTVERLYVDHHGFLANLDQCGELETLQISFAIVDGVKLAAPSAFKTSITVRLSSPPFVGRAVLVPLSERDIFLSFDIDNRDVARFLESLVERGLKDIIHQTERKLSKAKAHLEFDFQKSGSKRTPISTQDKVQNLARLWDTNASSSRHGDAMPTSPLLQGPAPQISSLRHKDNFGTADESDLSADEDDLPRQLLSTYIQCHGKAAAPISLDSDDEAGIMTRPRPRKNRPNIVLSEDEVVKIDQLSIKSNKAPKLAPRRIQEDALSVEEPSTEVLDYCKSSSNELALVSCGSGPELPYEKTNTVRDNDVPTKSQSAHQVIPPISSTGPLATDPSKMAEPSTILSNLHMLSLNDSPLQ